ncbi:FMRFamide receptor-like [Argonauta hians]
MAHRQNFLDTCARVVLLTMCMASLIVVPTVNGTKKIPPTITTAAGTTAKTTINGTELELEDSFDNGESNQTFIWRENSTQASSNQTTQKQKVSESMKQAIAFGDVMMNKVAPVLVALGILGNIMNLIVLSHKRMHGSTNCFLIALAASDMCLLAMQIGTFIVKLNNVVGYSKTYILAARHLQIIRYVTSNIFITCTSWLTIAVTVERFIAIRFPLKAKFMCTVRRAKITIAAIFITSFLFHLSKCFEYGVNEDTSDRYKQIKLMPLSHNKAYLSFMHVANIAIAVFIPEITLSVLNTLLVLSLAKHQAATKHMKKETSKDIFHITTVVITMVLVFMICHSIGLYLAISIAIYGRAVIFGMPKNMRLRFINNVLVLVNSSVNFILYATISQRFRETMKIIFVNIPKPLSNSSSKTSSTTASTKSSNKIDNRETNV